VQGYVVEQPAKLDGIDFHPKRSFQSFADVADVADAREKVFTQNLLSEISRDKGMQSLKYGTEFENVKKVSNTVFISGCTKQYYIIKHVSGYQENNKVSWSKRRRFSRECALTEAISTKSFTYLKGPRFIASNGSTYIVMELVNGVQPLQCGTYSKHLVKSIFELNTSLAALNIKWNGMNVVDRFARAPLPYVIRNLGLLLKKGILSKREGLRALYLCATLYKKQRTLPFLFLLHNDLGNTGNTLLSQQGNFYLLDFGGVFLERKFVLWDIVTVSLNFETLAVDLQSVYEYYELLPQSVKQCLSLQTQIHFCLLARFFFLLQHQHDSSSGVKSLDFLRNTLLSRKKFSNWYLRSVSDSTRS
jgi:hypothetical protein